MLAPHNRSYSFWIETPGVDAAEFLVSLAETMLSSEEVPLT